MLHFAGVVIAASSHAKYGLQPLHTFFGDDLVSRVFQICFFSGQRLHMQRSNKEARKKKEVTRKGGQ